MDAGATAVVSIVDGDAATRRTVGQLLQSAGIENQVFTSLDAFWALPEPNRPGVVICDLLLPGGDGLDLHHRLSQYPVAPPVILLSSQGDPVTVAQALRDGVFDYIAKPYSVHQLLSRVCDAIRQDAARRRYAHEQTLSRARLALLSAREREVLDLIMEGQGNKQMAFTLHLTEKAIEARRARVRDKLQVDSVVQLVRLVLMARGELIMSSAPALQAASEPVIEMAAA